ncbi:hypothetical protein [Selenomonas ruminis]|nr:hypothetical protein [Selenomonas sp. mPRGC5]
MSVRNMPDAETILGNALVVEAKYRQPEAYSGRDITLDYYGHSS